MKYLHNPIINVNFSELFTELKDFAKNNPSHIMNELDTNLLEAYKKLDGK